MTDVTRRLLLGYICVHLLMTDQELADAKERLAYFAASEGYTLGTVYTEQVETAPAAFQALIEALYRYEVTAVVVPSLHHFSVLGPVTSMKQYLEHCTGARVVVAGAIP
jgi:hypothetical protein